MSPRYGDAMNRLAPVALACAAVALLAGCSAPAHGTRPTHAAASPAPVPSFTESPALGASSTAAPYPNCSAAAAGWTGANGPLWITVQNVDGVDPITVQITEKSGATVTDSFTIPAGQNTHIFVEKTVAPTDVSKVLVTAKGNANDLGGSCWVQGGPNA